MARADRRRAQRAKPAAVTRRSDVVIEDTMFFPRLRRHAKWVFVFLALVFALGFVGFGVGAGGVGFGDILKGHGSGSGVPSVSDAQSRIDKNPKDAQAYRDLATAYEAKGDNDGAIGALESLTQLKPKNITALRELASLYLQKASDAQQRAQEAQLRASYLAPGAVVLGSLTLGKQQLAVDPINSTVNSAVSQDTNQAYGEVQSAAQSAVGAYKKIVAASPTKGEKAQADLNLGQIAQQTGDSTTAIAAYKNFLKLAPDDPSVRDVKKLLKQLGAG
jgi:tetratricopeptide (TPR) repeat protein